MNWIMSEYYRTSIIFEALRAVVMNSFIFPDITLSIPLKGNRRSEEYVASTFRVEVYIKNKTII
jgi:hypothetical protein